MATSTIEDQSSNTRGPVVTDQDDVHMPEQVLMSTCIQLMNVIEYSITPKTESLIITTNIQHEAGWQAPSDGYNLAMNDRYHSEMKNDDVISTSDMIPPVTNIVPINEDSKSLITKSVDADISYVQDGKQG
jgi:hypothetical protein